MLRHIPSAFLAIALVSAPARAQFGGMGGMGGGFGGPSAVDREVQAEMANGRTLSGRLTINPIQVDTEVGEYQIRPEKIKGITFERPQGENNPNQELKGSVATTSGKEFHGTLRIPFALSLQIDEGTLNLAPSRIKALKFQVPAAEAGGAKPQEQGAPATGSRSIRVTPISGPNIVALYLSGPKITRLAAAGKLGDGWKTIALKEPHHGVASPIVGPGLAVYHLRNHVYAYSSKANDWGVLDLPEGSHPTPIVGQNGITVSLQDHIYTFDSEKAVWRDFDLGAVIDEKP
jgi:hypothetical protein